MRKLDDILAGATADDATDLRVALVIADRHYLAGVADGLAATIERQQAQVRDDDALLLALEYRGVNRITKAPCCPVCYAGRGCDHGASCDLGRRCDEARARQVPR